jgi:uncharacterized protein YdhG (YjbR/CyaY superfamily)
MTKTHQEFISDFVDERKPLVTALLRSITEECPNLTETIKWNAPSFSDSGKDRMTIMLHKKNIVGLILHTGAKPKEDKKAPRLYDDGTGLLEWNSNVRATISFTSIDDFLAKQELFKKAVTTWISKTKDL